MGKLGWKGIQIPTQVLLIEEEESFKIFLYVEVPLWKTSVHPNTWALLGEAQCPTYLNVLLY